MGYVKKRYLPLVILSVAMGSSVQAEESQSLEEIEVLSDKERLNAQQQTINAEQLQKQASGETLGDYLDQQPNINSASYGPGVGRPVVRGMTGYRVKILQNDSEVSDLSAMSQDHAVGVMPKASERIELLKGPASLVYGATAGGSVRLVDSAQHEFPERGVHAELEASAASNNGLGSAGAKVTAASDALSFGFSGFKSQTGDYTDGNGDVVKDSDVLTEQVKLIGAWRYRPSGELIVSVAQLNKDYGIPNQTPAETRVDMKSDTYTLHLSETSPLESIDELSFDLTYTDYLHDETNGPRKDGLFGQKTLNMALSADYFLDDWFGKLLLSYRENELEVCHEHGGCDEFSNASRSGVEANVGASLENYLNTTGLPYSHGHPLPETFSRTLMFGGNGETLTKAWGKEITLSLGAHLELRTMEANPEHIQETWLVPKRIDADYYDTDNDFAGSLSAGINHLIGESVQSDINLSYLERLPSADELYWNGVHHATDSYIFGDRNLKKERSLNLDWDLSWGTPTSEWMLSAYAYYFWDYIYQDQLYDEQGDKVLDPFHLSDVWLTQQTDAVFTGLSVGNRWAIAQWRQVPIRLSNQVEWLQAKRSNGDNLPRTAPLSWQVGLEYAPENWSANISAKQVFEANALADNETATPAYTWVSLYADWQPDSAYGDWRLWLKGENLLDEYAQNHLSFLKNTAPLLGRQLSAGVKLTF